WFFERFVLAPLGEPPFDRAFDFVFNSYYDAVGPRAERARRGLVSRPSLAEIDAYRADVDARIVRALAAGRADLAVVELGLHHEQQHQELMLTDLKHALATQPLRPAYRSDLARAPAGEVAALAWHDVTGGVVECGAGDGFAFDCERPRHRVLLAPFRLASRPVCNAEVLAFIADGGYAEPRLWLADGFGTLRAPLYWEQRDGGWLQYALSGVREVDPAETACHLSYFEAD